MRIALIALITLLTSASGVADGPARIYVYADRNTVARSWRPISCDGTVVAKLKRGTFFAINVAPGRHVLSDGKSVPAIIDVRSGEETFVRLDWVFLEGEPATPVFSKVAASVAARDMIYLPYIDANKVLSISVSKTDPRTPPQLRLKTRDESAEK